MTGRADRLRAAPRCGARTRAGTPCRSPCVKDRPRCRMHGGARGSGGQKGNRNAYKHGFYSAPAKHHRRVVRKVCRDLRDSLKCLAAAPLIGEAEALRRAAAVDNDPGLAVPEDYDWRALWRLVHGDADPGAGRTAGCMGSMPENDAGEAATPTGCMGPMPENGAGDVAVPATSFRDPEPGEGRSRNPGPVPEPPVQGPVTECDAPARVPGSPRSARSPKDVERKSRRRHPRRVHGVDARKRSGRARHPHRVHGADARKRHGMHGTCFSVGLGALVSYIL